MKAAIMAQDLKVDYVVRKKAAGLFRPREKQIVHALNGVSFCIEKGSLVGYIGPNGAGKSTTVKVLGGILTPTSGTCQVLGRIPYKERTEHVGHIGVVFGQRTQLWWDLPVQDSFELLRDIYKVPLKEYHNNLDELVDAMQVEDLLGTPVRQLSLGQRMRCELVASLLHNPEVLFLDEPTIGLDAPSKLRVRQFILRQNEKRGTTVILTTHDMDDVETVCQRVLLIGHGRLLMDGSVSALRREAGTQRIMEAELEKEFAIPQQWPEGMEFAGQEGKTIKCRFDSAELSAEQALGFIGQNWGLRDVRILPPSIEEAVARLYERLQLEEGV